MTEICKKNEDSNPCHTQYLDPTPLNWFEMEGRTVHTLTVTLYNYDEVSGITPT